jgi:trk system potassium uptake protein TrkH
MNFRLILKNLGIVLITEAACMVLPMLVSIIYGQNDLNAFMLSILITVTVGFILYKIKPLHHDFYARDGFALVGISWFLVPLFGALPFMLSGAIPSFIDAVFETVSGFTTTGSTILKEIESLPRGILFWRSFTHWLGGMGVLVLMLAVLPKTGTGTVHIMQAESPGPTVSKLVPKLGQTAKILYGIYIIFTAIEVILLVIAGMPLYDSLIHTFGSAGTGGFSNRNLSVGAYQNVYAEVIITVSTLVFGTNFALYYQSFKGNIKSIFRDEEFRFYIGTVLISTLLIALNTLGSVFGTFWEALRHSSFQVSTIITTTGYATVDFNLWPTFSKAILVLLMFVGASAGSTGGGIKCLRIVLLFKAVKREIVRIIHPKSIYSVKLGGKIVEEETLTGIMAFFFAYMAIFVASILLVLLEGKDLVSSFTAVAATLGNVGPGLEIVGPMGNFSDFTWFSKAIFCFDMLVGRLEILPVLLLFAPRFWRRVNI